MEEGAAMMYVILALAALIAGLIMWQHKLSIDFASFIHATMALARDEFGVYCFTGHQGSGKTYSLVKWLKKYHKGREIYSNVHIKGIDYKPIPTIEALYELADRRNIIIVYDEIFTLMSKSKKDRQMLEQFLPQMRKAQNVFMTTAQYWLELDMTFRRFVRVQVECSTTVIPHLSWGILIEHYRDATKMKWDQLENEYVCPTIRTKLSRYEKRFMTIYDTFQTIKPLKN